MAISDTVVAFIAEQRRVLEAAEMFVETPGHLRLLAAAALMLVDKNSEPWPSPWPIEPVHGLRGLPIHVASQPGGLDRVEQHLKWISTFAVA